MIQQQARIFLSFSSEEYQRRHQAVWAEMEKRHLDGLVVYGDSGSHSGKWNSLKSSSTALFGKW